MTKAARGAESPPREAMPPASFPCPAATAFSLASDGILVLPFVGGRHSSPSSGSSSAVSGHAVNTEITSVLASAQARGRRARSAHVADLVPADELRRRGHRAPRPGSPTPPRALSSVASSSRASAADRRAAPQAGGG